MSSRAKFGLWTVFLLLVILVSNLIWLSQYKKQTATLAQVQAELDSFTQASDQKGTVLGFTDMFINKVLRSDGAVDLQTRIALERQIHETGDQELIQQWESFTSSEDEATAQKEVKKLLGLLIKKGRR